MANGAWRQEPRNLEPRKLILEAKSYFSRKFAPPKITRYRVYWPTMFILQLFLVLASVLSSFATHDRYLMHYSPAV